MSSIDVNEKLEKGVFPWMRDGHSHAAREMTTIKEVAHVGVPFDDLTEYLKQEMSESESCKSLPFALLVVVSYAITAIIHENATQVVAVEKSIEVDIEENANFAFSGPFIGHKDIQDVHSFSEFWSWMDRGFIPLIFVQGVIESETAIPPEFTTTTTTEYFNVSEANFTAEELADYLASVEEVPQNYVPEQFSEQDPRRGMLLHYNRIIGGVRMRQEVSKETPDCSNSVKELEEVYGLDCWEALKNYPIQPEIRDAHTFAVTSEIESRTEWLYAHHNLTLINEKVLGLELTNWLDNSTRRIEISIPVYNAEYGLFTMVNVNFYFSLGGKIWKDIVSLSTYSDWYPKGWYFVLDGIFMVCLVWIFGREIWEIGQVVNAQGPKAIITHYIGFWNAVDWISVIAGGVLVVIFFINVLLSEHLTKASQYLATLDPIVDESYFAELTSFMQDLEDSVRSCRQLRLVMAAYPLVIIMRLFKAFSAQQRLAVVTNTIWVSIIDLGHFMIVFASVFFSFAFSGVLLMGRQVRSFTRLGYAINQVFLGLQGQFDWDELRIVGRTEAGIWYVSFQVLLTILMFNILIAIVMDAYGVVKQASTQSEMLWEELAQEIQRQRGVWSRTLVPLSSIVAALDEQKNVLEKAHLRKSAMVPAQHTAWISAYNTKDGVNWRYFDESPLTLGLGIHDPKMVEHQSFLGQEDIHIPEGEGIIICTGFEDDRIELAFGTHAEFEVKLSQEGHIYFYRDTARKKRELEVLNEVVRTVEEEQLHSDLVSPTVLIKLMSNSMWNLTKKQANEIIYECIQSYYEVHNTKMGNEHLRTIGHYLDYRCDKLFRAIQGEHKHVKSGRNQEFETTPASEQLKKETFMRQIWRMKASINAVVLKLKAEGVMTSDGHVQVEQTIDEGKVEMKELDLGDEVMVVSDTRRLLSACAACGLSMKRQETRSQFAGACGIVTDIDKYDNTVCLTFKEPHCDVWFGINALCPKPPPSWVAPTQEALKERLEEQEADEDRQRRRERTEKLHEDHKSLKVEIKEMTEVLARLHSATREVSMELEDLRDRVEQQHASKAKAHRSMEKLQAKLAQITRENLAIERAMKQERQHMLVATDARNAYFEQIQQLMTENQEYRKKNIHDLEQLEKARAVLTGGELAMKARGGEKGTPTIEEARNVVEQHDANVKGDARELAWITGRIERLLKAIEPGSGMFLPHTQHELVKVRNMALTLGPVLQDSLH